MLCGKTGDLKVFARRSEKCDGPFHCPGCNNELILRKGMIKVHHFAHKASTNDCRRGEGESDAHRKCKETVFHELSKHSHITHLDVEVDFGPVIADAYCLINNTPVAIEVQRSNLSVSNITHRTREYEKLGIHVLWLGLYSEKLGKDRYSPRDWEKWCHATYFGRMHYWLADLTIIPIHFSDYQTYVEPSNWYDSSGSEQSAGGYFKSSKRYRKPVTGRYLNLATDFKPSHKREWRGGSIYVPECKIYGDKLNKWW